MEGWASQPLSDGREVIGSCRAAGYREGCGGLWWAPHTPRLAPGAVFVPTAGRAGLSPSVFLAQLAGWGGALLPDPKGWRVSLR